MDGVQVMSKNSAGECSRSGLTAGRKREETSSVSLNHPLAANSGMQENYA